MYSFVVSTKPKSYNSWGSASTAAKDRYKLLLRQAFSETYSAHSPVENDLYGLVYHFFTIDIRIDADNISKPIWDCLRQVVYQDDNQVKLRLAGSFDLRKHDFTILDLSGLSGAVIDLLTEALKTEDHVLYIECGQFKTELTRLNLEGDGN